MATKEIKRLDANLNLTNDIAKAIRVAHETGLSSDDIKTVLTRFTELLEEE